MMSLNYLLQQSYKIPDATLHMICPACKSPHVGTVLDWREHLLPKYETIGVLGMS